MRWGMENQYGISRVTLPMYVALVYAFLYIPIMVLVTFSFNESAFSHAWKGFTTDWYVQLWESTEVWDALQNSFIVALGTVSASLTMGFLIVVCGSYTFLGRTLILFYGSLAAPEIVTAVGLLSFFTLFNIPLGIITLIAAHTVMGLGYVVPVLHSRFSELDYNLIEASLDLGATRFQTFRSIVVPLMAPALLSVGLLVFIVSWDDFIISFFCSGGSAQTLPMYVFSMIRSGPTPVVNAISTLLLFITGICVTTFLSFRTRMGGMLW